MDQYVITLLHGTWAHGAAWTKDGSPLRALVGKEMQELGATIGFERLDWSGNNRHEDRRADAVKIRRELRELVRKHEKARHFVIAHSHGGNVALRAIRKSPFLRRRIEGV